MRLFCSAPLLVIILLVAGCAREALDYRAIAQAPMFNAQGGALAVAVPASSAAALLPERAGRIVRVAERRYADGLTQDIILDGARAQHGENRIEVTLRLQPEGDAALDNRLPMVKPSDISIAEEIDARFPGVRMAIVPVLLQNRYGPYGLAAGRRGPNERCIYAWQWIDDINSPSHTGAPGLVNALLLSQPQPISLRIRLCRSGVSGDQLAGLVNGLIIGGGLRSGVLPVLGLSTGRGDALTAASGGMVAGQDFAGYQLPQAEGRGLAETPPADSPKRRIAQRRRPHVARRQPEAEAEVATQAPPQFSTVPQPYVPAQPSVPTQAYVPQNAAVQPQYVQPQYAQPLASLHPLDQNLPAQAYRGPQAPSPNPAAPLYNTPGYAPQPSAPLQGPGSNRLLRDPLNSSAGI